MSKVEVLRIPVAGVIVGWTALWCGGLSMAMTLEWSISKPLPEPRSGYAAGAVNGKLVIAGGTYWEGNKGDWKQKLFTSRTHAFDPVNERWERLPDLPLPLGYAASAVAGDRLYVLGGYTGREINRRIYKLERTGVGWVWTVVSELPFDRLFARALAVGSSIYLLGGTEQFEPYDAAGTCCTSRTAKNSLLVFDTAQPDKGWRELPPFPGAKRWLFSAVSDGNHIWLFGGIDQDDSKGPTTRFNEILRYRIKDQAWEGVAALPQTMLEAAPLTPVYRDATVILVSFAKKVWQFDPKSAQFSELAPLPEVAFVDTFVWLDDRIVGAGGENKLEGPRRRSEWTFIGQAR